MLLDAPAWVLAAILVALAADALLGEPGWLYRHVPHPAVLLGRAVAALERRLLDPGAGFTRQRLAGVALIALLAGAAWVLGAAAQAVLHLVPGGWLAAGLLMSTLLAQRSLVQHVAAVAAGRVRAGVTGGPFRDCFGPPTRMRRGAKFGGSADRARGTAGAPCSRTAARIVCPLETHGTALP